MRSYDRSPVRTRHPGQADIRDTTPAERTRGKDNPTVIATRSVGPETTMGPTSVERDRRQYTSGDLSFRISRFQASRSSREADGPAGRRSA